MNWLKKLIENLHERYEYADFVEQLKEEQKEARGFRLLPTEYIEYELQEGMLPDRYEEMQPKPTGKYVTDFAWSKSKKK